MSKDEIVFTDGLKVRKVNDYKFGISINFERFTDWLKAYKNEQGYINIDICKSKEKESWYGKLNLWQPDKNKVQSQSTQDEVIINDEEIPF